MGAVIALSSTLRKAHMETVAVESPGKLATLAKCAHDGCICTVSSGERFCSDYCAEQVNGAKAATDDECNCGHPECAHAVGAPPVFGGFVAS
jgi:hypothetical protein